MKYVFCSGSIHEIMFFEPSTCTLDTVLNHQIEFGQAHLLPVRLELSNSAFFESAYDAATENVIPGHKYPFA